MLKRFLLLWTVIASGILGMSPVFVYAQDLSPQGIADISRPATLQVGTHIFGKVKIPSIVVNARAKTIDVVPDSEREVDVDEYFTGSSFVFQENGYLATNAHVVSVNTLKQQMVAEKALAALYENALELTDDEMDALLREEKGGFLESVFQFVLSKSTFDLNREVHILDPKRDLQTIKDAISAGQKTEVLVESPTFLSGGSDVALLKIDAAPAPALGFSDREVAVGERVYIAGYPSTAELGEHSSGEVTFTSGVVSAIRTTADGKKIYQTDAKISQGSSGGPVLNEQGQVIGIVTYQTDQLERESGDNFAFAQAIQSVSDIAQTGRIQPQEGLFAASFRKGFQAYIERDCQGMGRSFDELKKINSFYNIEKSVATYRKDCSLWEAQGLAHSKGVLSWQEIFLQKRDSFWWLFAGSAVFVGAIIILILWLFRQLERDEQEINRLNKRLLQDENEMFRQQKFSQQWFLEHDQNNKHSSEITNLK